LAVDTNAVANVAIADLDAVSLVPGSNPPVYILADATSEATPVHGFAAGASPATQPVSIWLPGTVIPGFSGLVVGNRYYLDKTAGQIVTTPLPAYLATNILHYVGTAYSVTQLGYFPDDYDVLEVDL
jgi:hypothetical protein